MADTAEFLVRLNNQISGPAAAAMGALGQLEAKFKATASAAAGGMVSGMGAAAGAMAAGFPAAVKGAAAALSLLGSTAKSVINGDIRGALSGLGSAAEGAMGKLTGALASLGPYGAAIASVLTVATGGVSALASSLLDGMQAALGMAEAGTKIKNTFNALAGGEKAGGATLKMVSELSAKLPFATGQIRTWAQSLLAAGLKGDKLKSAVEAVAAAQALMGDEGAAAAEKMIKGLAEGGAGADKMMADLQKGGKKGNQALAEMGLTTAKLAEAMGMTPQAFAKAKISAEQMNAAIQKALKKQGKDPLADMMNTWPVIMMKAKAGLMSLFSKIPGIPAFMAAVKSLFSQFNKGSSVIKALQPIFSQVFGTLFKYATMAVSAISKFVKENLTAKNIGKVWSAVKEAIGGIAKAIAPAIDHIKKAAKSGALLKGLEVAFKVVAVVARVVAGAIGAVIDIVVSGIESAAALGAIFDSLGGSFSGAGDAISSMASGAIDALSGWASGAVDAAGNFISGLLSGIQAGAGAIIAAVAGLAGSALGAFKSALGIASPSKVMMQMGGHMTTGAAEGIDDGTAKVEKSSEQMGGAAADGASRGMSGVKGGKGKGGSGAHFEFNNCQFGSMSRTEIEEIFVGILDRDSKAGAVT